MAGRSAILRRPSARRTNSGTRRRSTTLASVSAPPGFYRLSPLLPYHFPPGGTENKDGAFAFVYYRSPVEQVVGQPGRVNWPGRSALCLGLAVVQATSLVCHCLVHKQDRDICAGMRRSSYRARKSLISIRVSPATERQVHRLTNFYFSAYGLPANGIHKDG
jgi:hypothetical protein